MKARTASRFGFGATAWGSGAACSTIRSESPGLEVWEAICSCSSRRARPRSAARLGVAGRQFGQFAFDLVDPFLQRGEGFFQPFDLETAEVGAEGAGVGVGEFGRELGVAGRRLEAEDADPRFGRDVDAGVELRLLAFDHFVFVGDVEDGAGRRQLVVDVGEAEQFFLAEDFARGLAGGDDLAERVAFEFVGFGGGDQVDDHRGGNREKGQPFLGGPDESKLGVRFHSGVDLSGGTAADLNRGCRDYRERERLLLRVPAPPSLNATGFALQTALRPSADSPRRRAAARRPAAPRGRAAGRVARGGRRAAARRPGAAGPRRRAPGPGAPARAGRAAGGGRRSRAAARPRSGRRRRPPRRPPRATRRAGRRRGRRGRRRRSAPAPAAAAPGRTRSCPRPSCGAGGGRWRASRRRTRARSWRSRGRRRASRRRGRAGRRAWPPAGRGSRSAPRRRRGAAAGRPPAGRRRGRRPAPRAQEEASRWRSSPREGVHRAVGPEPLVDAARLVVAEGAAAEEPVAVARVADRGAEGLAEEDVAHRHRPHPHLAPAARRERRAARRPAPG